MEKRKSTRGRARAKAATRDIVGTTPPDAEVPLKWRKYYNRLRELRASLQRRQDELTMDALEETPNYSLHIADAGTDAYDRDFALGMLSSQQDAVYEIDEALHRIRNGSYAVCELTGRKIEPDRLEAIPWTRFSAEAERQLEKEGGVPRARLGEREAVPRIQAAEEPEETE